MKRLIRSIVLGGTTAIALIAGPASAHDNDYARRPLAPVSAPASVRPPLRHARWEHGGERAETRWEYGELAAARERFYHGWHGDRRDRERFERWCAVRRSELDRRWAYDRARW